MALQSSSPVPGERPWLIERLVDAAAWPVCLVLDLPRRLGRLGTTLGRGATGVVDAGFEAVALAASPRPRDVRSWLKGKAGAGELWLLELSTRLLDLAGAPELGDLVIRSVSHATRLEPAELSAAQAVLGPLAVRWGQVRIAQGGLLELAFRRNGGRAFATFHTVNLPGRGVRVRTNLGLLVHELTHVRQHEVAGSVYIVQALFAQTRGEGYGYEGADGLRALRELGRAFRDLNREQQASVAQDFYTLLQGQDRGRAQSVLALYQPFIDELRSGQL